MENGEKFLSARDVLEQFFAFILKFLDIFTSELSMLSL